MIGILVFDRAADCTRERHTISDPAMVAGLAAILPPGCEFVIHGGPEPIDEVEARLVDGELRVVPASGRSAEEIAAIKWMEVRQQRDAALAASDWTELASVRARRSAAWADAWDAYRNALRDITAESSPDDIEWPSAPLGNEG